MPKEKKTRAKKTKDLSTLRSANKPEYVTGTGQELWRVHLKQDCMHRICDIHNPPQGLPESDWPTHWRGDRGLMERICPHGVGHPTKAHMLFLKEMDAVRGTENYKWEGIHGCDGCCGGNYQGDDDEPYGVDDEDEEPFVLDPEISPYFRDEPMDFLSLLFERTPTVITPNTIRRADPEWVDRDAAPNGIGPVCRWCQLLIDWDPTDHALDCGRLGTTDGLG